MRAAGVFQWCRFLCTAAVIGLGLLSGQTRNAFAQEDDSVVIKDGGGDSVLQSVFIPPIANAPFSLTLSTEWSRPLGNGGTYTVVNSRPIRRDSVGRIYEERWILVPKGSSIHSQISWIQIADPVAHTLYNCRVSQRVCELLTYDGSATQRYRPSMLTTGPMPNGKGTWTHEDLGTDVVAGVVVHGYRDTTTVNPGVFGNDRPMTTVREFRWSPDLNFNLSSVLDTPSLGRQMFTVTSITTAEPDAAFFRPPSGYTVVDHRKPAPSATK